MRMTSQHSKIRQITPLCPNIQLYTQKCIQQVFKCSMHVSNRKVIYKGDIDERSMPKDIPIFGPQNPSGYTHIMLHKSTHEFET